MVKQRKRPKLGAGYYHPAAISVRIQEAKAKGRTRRVDELMALLERVIALPPTRKLTKSWRSVSYRADRYNRMKEMRKTMTLAQIGKRFGLTRERVRQILSK